MLFISWNKMQPWGRGGGEEGALGPRGPDRRESHSPASPGAPGPSGVNPGLKGGGRGRGTDRSWRQRRGREAGDRTPGKGAPEAPLPVHGGHTRRLGHCPAQPPRPAPPWSPPHPGSERAQPQGSVWGCSSARSGGLGGALGPGSPPRSGGREGCPCWSFWPEGWPQPSAGQKASVPRPLPADLMREGQRGLSLGGPPGVSRPHGRQD